MNSRVRSTPARGRASSRSLTWNVIEDQRQVAVGAHHLRHVRRDRLLVGHREHQLRALAVGQLEQRIDVIAPRALPDLGGLQDRHQHLLTADRVHLLADDRHRMLVKRQPAGNHVQMPAPSWRIEPGSHHQLVRDRLGVGGRLALGGQ